MKLRNHICILFILGSFASVSHSSNNMPPEVFARQFIAESFASAPQEQEPTIDVQAPDSRLQLAPCKSELQGFWPGNSRRTGHTIVGVKCEDAGGWQVFLPARISIWQEIVVNTRPLSRGHKLQASDLALKRTSIDQIRGVHYNDINDLIGSTLKISIQGNSPMTNQVVCTICRGEPVTIQAKGVDFAIRTKGEALSQGNTGEYIKVRNLHSKRAISAKVIGPNVVEVAL